MKFAGWNKYFTDPNFSANSRSQYIIPIAREIRVLAHDDEKPDD